MSCCCADTAATPPHPFPHCHLPQIYTVGHHLDPVERSGPAGFELTQPVRIEDDVWLGGGSIILPGVTIGELNPSAETCGE